MVPGLLSYLSQVTILGKPLIEVSLRRKAKRHGERKLVSSIEGRITLELDQDFLYRFPCVSPNAFSMNSINRCRTS